MKFTIFLIITVLTLLTSISFADQVELALSDGTVWRGDTGQQIALVEKKGRKKTTIEGTLVRNAGQYLIVMVDSENKIVFITDIVSISTPQTTDDAPTASENDSVPDDTESNSNEPVAKSKTKYGKLPHGVFLLPLDGGVGEIIRSTEIQEIAEHADTYGPGQIIILDINSPGGSVLTGIQMRDLLYDIRKRHRVIAWVDRATSGGAFLAFCCDEIYFRRSSNFGSITMWSGNFQGAAEPEMSAWITQIEGVLAKSSRTPLFAAPMVVFAAQLTYDIDEETGKITYYDNLTGEFVLSDGQSVEVLSITAEQADHCGLSDGTADTLEELAALLDLDAWNEIDDKGRKLAKNWKALSEQATEEITRLFEEFNGNVEARTNGERIMKQIQAGKSLLTWANRVGESAMNYGLAPYPLAGTERVDAIKRQIKELEQQR